MTRYYTLAQRVDGNWYPQFGDYDRSVVQDELQDYRDHDVRAKDLMIVTCDDESMAAFERAMVKALRG